MGDGGFLLHPTLSTCLPWCKFWRDVGFKIG